MSVTNPYDSATITAVNFFTVQALYSQTFVAENVTVLKNLIQSLIRVLMCVCCRNAADKECEQGTLTEREASVL